MADVPKGLKAERHPQFGVVVEPAEWAAYRPVQLLPEAQALSELYTELRIGTGGNGFGPNPVSWEAIAAYCQLTRIRLDRWHLGLLRMVDAIYLKCAAERAERERKSKA